MRETITIHVFPFLFCIKAKPFWIKTLVYFFHHKIWKKETCSSHTETGHVDLALINNSKSDGFFRVERNVVLYRVVPSKFVSDIFELCDPNSIRFYTNGTKWSFFLKGKSSFDSDIFRFFFRAKRIIESKTCSFYGQETRAQHRISLWCLFPFALNTFYK